MIDKLKRIEDFIQEIERNLEGLNRVMLSSERNLILVNINSTFITKYILKWLKKNNVDIQFPTEADIMECGSLGGFLRYQKELCDFSNSCLILDFYEELSGLYSNSQDLSDDININRDLFRNAFNNVIILTSPYNTYSIMRYSIDFKSCISYYADMTKWFCSIVPIPLVKIRTFSNLSSILVDSYQKNKELFLDFMDLKDSISKVTTYTHEVFVNYLNEINKFNNYLYHCDLLNDLIDRIVNIEAKKGTNESRIKDLQNIAHSVTLSIETVDILIVLAEFFYKENCFSESIFCYQKSNQILIENGNKDKNNQAVISYIQCNIVVCNYLLKNKHSPEDLMEELKFRLICGENMCSSDQIEFMKTYLLLVSCSIQHYSFSQHIDLFKNLTMTKKTSFEIMDLSESYDVAYSWSCFIDNYFFPAVMSRKKSDLTEIIYYVQKMIYFFSKGDYVRARNSCKTARSKAKLYGYIQMYEIIDRIWKNMKYLYKESMMIDIE